MKRLTMVLLVTFLVTFAASYAQADELVGMISRMEGNVAVISLTKSKGIEPGMIFYIYRAGKFVGRAEVSEVGSINSRIMALPDCKGLMVGDAVSTRPACAVYRPLPPYGRNVSPNFILRETDGRAVVVGKIDPSNLELVRKQYRLGRQFVKFQNVENAEKFCVELSHTGSMFLELPPGTYVIQDVHIVAISGVDYNAWGIPVGIIPGFFMRNGGKVFPISYKFTVPEKSDVVYIGTLKFNINPGNPYTTMYKPLPTYTSVVDEYDSAMSDLRSLNPFVRKIGALADTHLEIKADKSIMELLPAGSGSLFQARGDMQSAVNEYLNSINYREAPYRAEAHNALAGYYWDREEYYQALIHYDFAKQLGYPVPEDRMKALFQYRWYTKPSIE